MSIANRLASANQRRDHELNIALAEEIAAAGNRQAVKELVDLLVNGKKAQQHDSIKVLYEIGERQPALISGYAPEFGRLLRSKDNWMVWGGMTALDTITSFDPKSIYLFLADIIRAADTGSVITRDHAVSILVKLGSLQEYAADCRDLLLEQLLKCPPNQLPSYAEQALALITPAGKQRFEDALAGRIQDLEKESQRKRLDKVLRKIQKM